MKKKIISLLLVGVLLLGSLPVYALKILYQDVSASKHSGWVISSTADCDASVTVNNKDSYTVVFTAHPRVQSGGTITISASVTKTRTDIDLTKYSLSIQSKKYSVTDSNKTAVFTAKVKLMQMVASPLEEIYTKNSQGYYGVKMPDDDSRGWLRSTNNGFLPYSNGHSSLGTSSWRFSTAHINTIYENGVKLSSKYASVAKSNTNASNISSNLTKVNANVAKANTNASNISKNLTKVNTNTSKTNTNTSNISSNLTKINSALSNVAALDKKQGVPEIKVIQNKSFDINMSGFSGLSAGQSNSGVTVSYASGGRVTLSGKFTSTGIKTVVLGTNTFIFRVIAEPTHSSVNINIH